jgi:hypothetical protein
MSAKSLSLSSGSRPLLQRSEDDDPFLAFRREMNRLFDDVFSGFGLPARPGSQPSRMMAILWDRMPYLTPLSVRRFAPDGVDAVLALAGGDALERCLEGLRSGGRLASERFEDAVKYTGAMRYELTDYEWVSIKPFLPNKPRGVRTFSVRHSSKAS